MSVERIGSGTTRDHRRDAWWGVHAARYNFAVPFVKERRVLDIACGTGYGLPVLHRVASAVVGVDVEFLAARKARGDGQERALVADGCRLPFEDGSFDVATSFETLEHIQQRSTFVSELRRVLARDGLLILSTPNANHTRPVDGKPHNPYHVFEYKPSELTAELGAIFDVVELLGQSLDPRFKISPFIDDQQKLPRTICAQTRLLLWRVLYKLPASQQDWMSRLLWGHPLIPGDTDYRFHGDDAETAPVLVALCR